MLPYGTKLFKEGDRVVKILLVGYSATWKQRVLGALPDEADVTIKGDQLEAAIMQERATFDLYILGNRLLSETRAAVYLLEEAQIVEDKTPTIVFSQEFDAPAADRIVELGATLIRSDATDADELLAQSVRKLLKIA
ncbi:MAG: hypothetical protein RL538_881 [Candidatus Parcubacteria bacterium]